MNRTPREIADDLKTLRAGAKLAFVPLDIVRAVDLMIEFAESVTVALEHAGVVKLYGEAGDETEAG